MPLQKNRDQIERMRESGRIVARTLRLCSESIVPGKTTPLELDKLADRLIREEGGFPSFLGYRDFPYAVCVSVNEMVVHGIPNRRALQEGDIVTLDFGVVKNGWHADGAWTYGVGNISQDAARLMAVTKESLMQGLHKAKAGHRTGEIGQVIETYVQRHGYGIVRDLVGHGIGQQVHEKPEHVPNYGPKHKGDWLKENMTICVEPMVNQGTPNVIFDKQDKWTVRTADNKLSAHYEHTVVVTKGAVDILTLERD